MAYCVILFYKIIFQKYKIYVQLVESVIYDTLGTRIELRSDHAQFEVYGKRPFQSFVLQDNLPPRMSRKILGVIDPVTSILDRPFVVPMLFIKNSKAFDKILISSSFHNKFVNARRV